MMPRVFTLLLFLIIAIQASRAEATRPLLTDYTHTAWTELDGAPSGSTRFAQGADGWLWIASPTGLYRFDGVRFEHADKVYGFPLQSSNLMAVTSASDGALWVGYRVGTVTVFRKNGAHTYMEDDGLNPVGVMHIAEAPDGGIWVAMRDGLAVLAPGAQRFEYLRGEVGLPPMGIFQVLFARDGTAWVGTNKGPFFRRKGEARFSLAYPRVTLVSLAEAPDGTIWGNDPDKHTYQISVADQPVPSQFESDGVLFDRHGTLWAKHPDRFERKLSIVSTGGPEQYLTKADNLSGLMPVTAFEDREGNLWLGTTRGVDRLRPNRLLTVDLPLRAPALVAGPGGTVWVGDYEGDLWRYNADGRLRREEPGAITASYAAPDGVLWLGGLEGVKRRDANGTVTLLPFPDHIKGLRVHALQQDGDGALWGSFSTNSVYKLVDGQWIRNGGLQGIPNTLTASMARDAAGRLWMGHVRSEISVVDGAALRRLGPEQGLKLGTVLAMTPDGDAMWVGGEQGVALYRAGRFVTLGGEHGEAFAGVSGIARLPNGELWLNGAEGLYRISAGEVRRWLGHSATAVAFARFNAQDGMQGHAQQWRPLPSLLYGSDGLLWFATSGSVGTVDPAHLRHNPLPPPVEVTGLHADGLRYGVAGTALLSLPKGTRDLQIDFTALSLSIPERVRLRYRLVGWDDAWKEAVGRREAYYTNLAPGKYRFEVIAANEDGVWNTKGAALDMKIPPTFVQSIWFKLLLTAACLLILYAAYVLRIRYLTQLIQERTAERMRIARTLHDTLLQSMQALLLSFDAHSRHLKEGTPERRRLDQTLNLAEQLLVEGRDQIMDLRTAVSPEVLSLTLEEFGKGLAEHRTHAFQMRVMGTPRQLRPGVHEEVYAIGREALFNASRYAEATRIELELEYSASAFVLRIRDNGRGLEEEVAIAGGKPGHWGLSGMRERAEGIGAQLEIASEMGSGIEITLTLPARRAY